MHLDGKNVPGSYSALIILEVGAAPAFCGGLYLVPQVRNVGSMYRVCSVQCAGVAQLQCADYLGGWRVSCFLRRPVPGSTGEQRVQRVARVCSVRVWHSYSSVLSWRLARPLLSAAASTWCHRRG